MGVRTPISMRQSAAILTLWGIYDGDPSREAMDRLAAWLKENYGVEHWRFLGGDLADKAIAQLDKMATRALRQRQATEAAILKERHAAEAGNARRAAAVKVVVSNDDPPKARAK